MECLYVANLSETSESLSLEGDEVRHARALRLQQGHRMLVVNGKGLGAEAEVVAVNARSLELGITALHPGMGESPTCITVAMGILHHRERIEFAVEKCTELGMTTFVPLVTQFVQRHTVNVDRLRAKALAAMKQSQRSFCPQIEEPMELSGVLHNLSDDASVLLCDNAGQQELPSIGEEVCLLIGPEGGFSVEERELLMADSRSCVLALAGRRLRSETAAIAAMARLSAAL